MRLYRRERPLYIEYKPSETRGRCFVDSAAKALCLLNDINIDSIGITLDFGHSMYTNENPAEAVSLLEASPFKYSIHINDNDGKRDWDYFTSGRSPTRWDIKGTFEANSRMTINIWPMFDRIGTGRLETLMVQGDYIQTWKFIEQNIFCLK